MNRTELISRLDDGIAALRDLADRTTHSDNQIRIGTRFYTRARLNQMIDAVEEVAFDVGEEP